VEIGSNNFVLADLNFMAEPLLQFNRLMFCYANPIVHSELCRYFRPTYDYLTYLCVQFHYDEANGGKASM